MTGESLKRKHPHMLQAPIVTRRGLRHDGRMIALAFALTLWTGADQSLKPAGYVARGNEPGWHLLIDSAAMVLTQMDGGEKRFPLPKQQPITGGYRYALTLNGAPTSVDVLRRLCHDSMSGMSYPDTVTVATGGKTLKGCGGDPASLLAGNEWKVESIAGVAMLAQGRPTLSFTEVGRIAGNGSCNRYSAAFTMSGEGLTVGAAAATKMACAPALMQQEDNFFKVLATVFRHDVTGLNTLVLEGKDGKKIVAKR